MYKFEEDVVDKALTFYTLRYCGEFDEDFYLQAAVDCYENAALEACVVLDYLEVLYEDFLKGTPLQRDQYQKSLDGRN